MQDTSEISDLQQTVTMKNPYPGLRPFLQEDSHLFFGRENQVSDVLAKLIQNNFVAIIGNSGIGKSSFINCGILPKLYADHPGVISNEWDVINFRPGNDPILQLSGAFAAEVKSRKLYSGKTPPQTDDIYNILNTNGYQGFSEMVKNFIKSSGKNLLLFIDQFEEVFRFKPEAHEVTDKISLFIDILIKTAKSEDIPVFIIITMRSDYIGECSRYPLLTSAINLSQFLIPQMTRDEKKSAITGPCHVMGGKISDALVNEILNKVGDDADQLPVMQHALMRSWDYWEENKIGNEELGINHYYAIGGMETALSVHANEVFNNLPAKLKQTCEKCFKSLTEKGEEGRSFRRPATIKELADIAQASIEDVKEIVDNFRKPGRTILTPPYGTELEEDTIIDISHESLMRIWGTLTNWMDEEYESTKQYLKIAEAAELHQSGKGTLLKSPELQMATNWYHEEMPTKAWGIRHHVAYDRTIEYLLFSEKQFLREQRLKTRQQKRRLFIARLVAIVFGSGAVIAGLLVVFAVKQREKAKVEQEEAVKQRERANIEAANALASFRKAQEETRKAEDAAQRARSSEKQANISRLKAEEQEKRATEQGRLATIAEKKALTKEQEARKLRMFSIARSMAVKSLLEPNDTTKSLVSRQAYNFYFDNDGDGTDPDIYNALYYSVKELKGDDKFNTLSGHTDNVRAIVTNPRSNKFYSTGSDGKIFRWTSSDKDFEFTSKLVDLEEGQVNKTMALSSNGNFLVVGGDFPYLLLYNLSADKNKPKKIETTHRSTLFLDFTPDNGHIVFVGSNNMVSISDFNSVTKIDKLDGKLNSMDVDPSGKYAAIGMESGKIVMYDLQNNYEVREINPERSRDAITSIKFGNNGRMLAVGTIKGRVHIVNVKTGESVAPLTGHTARVNQLCFNNSNNKLATASYDHTVRIWDLDNYLIQPVILNDHSDWVWSIAFSNDDKYLFAGCRDKLVRSWIMDIHTLATSICKESTVNRMLTKKEWENYVAEDIDRECTCKKKCN